MERRKVLYKKWVPAIYIASDGSEHDAYNKASTICHTIKPFVAPQTKKNTNMWGDYTEEGICLGFGTVGDVDGMETVGIVENVDGTVSNVSAENIKFIDK